MRRHIRRLITSMKPDLKALNDAYNRHAGAMELLFQKGNNILVF